MLPSPSNRASSRAATAPDLDAATKNADGTTKKSNDVVKQFGTGKGSIQVPLAQDPASVLGLLMGRRTDLFVYDLPSLDLDVNVTKSFPVFPGLNARIGGEISVTSALSFGFDTTGVEQWAKEGDGFELRNLDLLFNGFYFGDFDADGNERPELTLSAGLKAGASVGLGGLVEAGVGGGITATVGLDLADIPLPGNEPDGPGDGRLYFDEIAERLDPGSRMPVRTARRTAGLPRGVLLGGDRRGLRRGHPVRGPRALCGRAAGIVRLRLPAAPSLDVAAPRPGTGRSRSAPSTTEGTSSTRRIAARSPPMAEQYGISLVTGDSVDRIAVNGNGSEEFFDPADVTKIVILGTEFDDSYSIGPGIAANIEIHGLAGNDTVTVDANSANHTRKIWGGAGRDTIMGSSGNDIIYGDEETPSSAECGGDPLELRCNDVIYGNGGLDELHGGDDDDFIQGGDQADRIWGDAGDDRLVGGDGADTLYGGTGNDALLGESGNDFLYGVTDLVFVNRPLSKPDARNRDFLSGGAGDDTIHGGDGDDTIIGGTSTAAGDTLQGHAGADGFIWRSGDGVANVYGSDAQSDPSTNQFDDKVSLLAYTTDDKGNPIDPMNRDVVTLSASGVDVVADWNGVGLTLHGIHSVDLDTGDGADTVVVHDLRGTTLARELKDEDGNLLGNLNIALGSTRTVVTENRTPLDKDGKPKQDAEEEEFKIVSKAVDTTMSTS